MEISVRRKLPSNVESSGPVERPPKRSSSRRNSTKPGIIESWIDGWSTDFVKRLHIITLTDTSTPSTAPAISADPSTPAVPASSDTEKEVTLTTTKHQEVRTFLRPNFPTPEYPNPAADPNPITHPDVDPSAATDSPFYSPVPIATFHRLPHLRPSVFYVFGDPAAGAFLSASDLESGQASDYRHWRGRIWRREERSSELCHI